MSAAHRYILLFKPYGVLCKFSDVEGRPTLAELDLPPHVYPAGRLDKDSEGLLFLTDDNQVAHRLTHRRFEHPRVYLVQVERAPGEASLEALRRGVVVRGKPTRPIQAERLEHEPDLPPRPVPIRYRKNVPTAWLRLTLTEGRNRQVRRMTAAVGHPTLRLVRVAIGPLALGDLGPGQWRDLSPDELAALRVCLKLPRRA